MCPVGVEGVARVIFFSHVNKPISEYLKAVVLAQAKMDIQNLPLGTYGGELEKGFNWNLTRYSVSKRDEGFYKRALMQITWKDLYSIKDLTPRWVMNLYIETNEDESNICDLAMEIERLAEKNDLKSQAKEVIKQYCK